MRVNSFQEKVLAIYFVDISNLIILQWSCYSTTVVTDVTFPLSYTTIPSVTDGSAADRAVSWVTLVTVTGFKQNWNSFQNSPVWSHQQWMAIGY